MNGIILNATPWPIRSTVSGSTRTWVFLVITAWHLVILQSSAAAWFQKALVGMEVGPTGAQFGHSDTNDTRYSARFDGREIVRRSLEAHAEYLVMWVRDGDYAYYDSKILPKAQGLGDRDPLRDAVDEARGKSLPILAYCVVQQGGHFLNAHPEFAMRGADGKPLGRFCFNSGYLESMKSIVAEQLTYGIAGFHLDMLDQGFGPPYGCWCDTCQKQYQTEFGHLMPKGATWDDAWDRMLEFRYRSSERFERALVNHIKSIRPEATVDFNYHGNPPFSFEVGQRPVQHAGNADFVTGETGIWGFSALGVGFNAEFYRASTPGKPFQVAIQRGVHMYHDQTTRPLNDIRWELFTLLAHGAFVTMIDKTGFDGSLDLIAYNRMGTAFAEALAKRAHFNHTPVYDIGLWFSSRSRDWIGRENSGRWFQSIQGAQRACALEHLQFGIILDENANPDTLRPFPIVCLPDVGILSDKDVGLLRRYVEAGGNLLITGRSGQYDRMGNPLAQPNLAGMIGAIPRKSLDSMDNWVRRSSRPPPGSEGAFLSLDKDLLGAVLPPNWPVLVKGPATVYQPTGALHAGDLLKPHRTRRQLEGREGTDWPMSPEEPVGPAVLLNRVGSGQVLTMAASPDFATASDHPVVEARQLFRAAVRYLNPKPRIRIQATASVEAVVTDDIPNRSLRVHFITYNPTPQGTPDRNRPLVMPGLIEDAPMFRATIETSDRLKSVSTVNPGSTVKRNGNRVDMVIEDIHEVVVLKY